MSGRINKRRIKKGRKEASDQSKGAARPRAAKKDPYTDEGILFGPKSPLIEMDLHVSNHPQFPRPESTLISRIRNTLSTQKPGIFSTKKKKLRSAAYFLLTLLGMMTARYPRIS